MKSVSPARDPPSEARAANSRLALGVAFFGRTTTRHALEVYFPVGFFILAGPLECILDLTRETTISVVPAAQLIAGADKRLMVGSGLKALALLEKHRSAPFGGLRAACRSAMALG